MKAQWIVFFWIACSTVLAMGNGSDMERLQSLIESAKARASSCQNHEEALIEALPGYTYEPEFRALQRELSKSWRLALEHLEELAPDDMTKTLVLCSCWHMDEDEFGMFLLEVTRLTEEGNVSPQIFRWCQWPFESPLRGYLLRHANDASVREIEARSRKIFNGGEERTRKADVDSTCLAATDAKDGLKSTTTMAPPKTAGRKGWLPIVMVGLVLSCAFCIFVFRRKT